MNPWTNILGEVRASRMADDLWALVNVPSPTGQEADCARLFAKLLRKAGAEVEIDETLPASPSVIGRLRGTRPGRVLQLAGHLDHIAVPHAPPTRDKETISARGASDMKAGLAGILETVRVLHGAGCPFAGEILVTAYGLHEAPVGDSAALFNLIARGIKGDAAVITEAGGDKLITAAKGMAIWNLRVIWNGRTSHELHRPPDADGLPATVQELMRSLLDLASRLRQGPAHPLLGPESLFIGQVHFGDFYNRTATSAHLQGTRRWNPGKTLADAKAEMEDLVARLPSRPNIACAAEWTPVGESYSIRAGEPIARALDAAYRDVAGAALEEAGLSGIADSARLVPAGGVPSVLLAFDDATAHSDRETVSLARLERQCRILMLTVLRYLAES
jgi:acetylornithine deacetylase/succinyl-diaminopimelate desuccinylase-like protein